MFIGNDPDGSGYKTRAHLAEVISVLGPPPADLLNRGLRSNEFFDTKGPLTILHLSYVSKQSNSLHAGVWKADVPIPNGPNLTALVDSLPVDDKRKFLHFMQSMLQWRPEDRKTADQMLDDPWLRYRRF